MIGLAAQGIGEGFWLRAVSQTAGRGRLSRDWVSPPGNLYASTIVRTRPGDPPPATLALVAAVALDEVAVAYAAPDRLALKWPNDLLLDGAKLSGILLERSGDAVIAGVGVNLAHHPDGLDRPVTSLAAAGFGAPDPALFVTDLAQAFARWLSRWRQDGIGDIRTRWVERAHPRGTALAVHMPGADPLPGLFDGLDDDGALRLRLADGTTRRIHAGDVFML
jgi:BirA family biotin operon repressor/biotin-[acetyl-CoA-carboxylase] ligase